MSKDQIFPVSAEIANSAWIDNDTYLTMYQASVDDPEAFWGEHGKRIDWMKPYTKVKDVDYRGDVRIKWYYDGTLNVSYNCVDRHLESRGDQTAILWEGDDPSDSLTITYRELHEQVCRLANAMKAEGIKKGDVVTIYMPMVPEAAVAMLACARIGAIHSVVFGGFSPDSLAGRIQDCSSCCVITADEGVRGGKPIPLKANTDAALESCPTVKKVFVVERTKGAINWEDGRRYLVSRRMRCSGYGLSAGRNERGRPAFHSLYLWFHWKAQGRLTHYRWIYCLRLHDPSICIRLP